MGREHFKTDCWNIDIAWGKFTSSFEGSLILSVSLLVSRLSCPHWLHLCLVNLSFLVSLNLFTSLCLCQFVVCGCVFLCFLADSFVDLPFDLNFTVFNLSWKILEFDPYLPNNL